MASENETSTPAVSSNIASSATTPVDLRRLMLIVFAVALGVRVFVVLWLNFAPVAWRPVMPIFANDAVVYDELARNLLAGEGYHFQGEIMEISAMPPLFSVFLAVLYAVGLDSVPAVGLVNALLAAVTAVVLFDLVRLGCTKAHDRAGEATATRLAYWSALIFALYPLEIFNTPFVLKENFSIFLTVTFVYMWCRILTATPTVRPLVPVTAGLLLGCSVMSRFPHFGLIFIFFVCSLWWGWRAVKLRRRGTDAAPGCGLPAVCALPAGFGRACAVTLAVCLLVLAPWLYRNYRVFGQPVLTPHGPGRHLYFSNSKLSEPESNGYYEARGQAREQDTVDYATRHDRLLQEKTYARNALRDIVSSPLHVAKLVAAKLTSMWRPVWAGSSVRSWIMLGIPYLAMMALALPGLWFSYRDVKKDESWLHPRVIQVLWIMIGFYFVGHAVFYGMIRERQYVEPYLIVFAAYTLVRWKLGKVSPQSRSEGASPVGA